MTSILNSGIKLVRNVGRYNIGPGSIGELRGLLSKKRSENKQSNGVVFLIDDFFTNYDSIYDLLNYSENDYIEFISTRDEPTTEYIDLLKKKVIDFGFLNPVAIVGFGGGITLDIAKAISNLITNDGLASDYQGWDLVKNPGVFKVGIPTISGTGAEATRTCVITNKATGLKLGMNSDFTVFDHIILDPELMETVPRNQYFYTGMDAYIHCIEALSGTYRNAIGDAFSRETINLCRSVFQSKEMQSRENRERLMVASYLGGCSIATSYVGVVHPFSAALSVVFDLHHCIANCITMRAMQDFYPKAYDEFWLMAEEQKINIPKGMFKDLSDEQYRSLYNSMIIHERPLTNALGSNFKNILSEDKAVDLFLKM